jgi:phosphoribosylformylglycinamidine cyclo-ligase
MTPAPIRYADAGVDRQRAEAAKRKVALLARRTFTRGVLADIGAFGALFELPTRRWRRPVLISSADGVGTKLKVAALTGRYDSVAADLVHHCVNDIAVLGATPIFFLDYVAAARLDAALVQQTFAGLSRACRALRVALIGGETAEMPGVYAAGEYDLVGFIVGVAEKAKILDARRVRRGDVLIGLPSAGLHTNGYSLARKLLFEVAGYGVDSFVPELGNRVGDELLKPHWCYYSVMKPLLERGWLSAAAHITGGGITENLPRALPAGCAAEIRLDAWPLPPLFRLLERLGSLPPEEMLRTFNMGIGMILVVPSRHRARVESSLRRARSEFYRLGEVVRGRRQVRYRGSWR